MWLLLGAYGDLCSVLPIIRQQALLNNDVQQVIVARPYADLFTGTSYAQPILFEGHYSQLPQAEQKYLPQFKERLTVVQCYGAKLTQQTRNFVSEMWLRAGVGEKAKRYPLIFNRRSIPRETELCAKFADSKPLVLFVGEARSAPYADQAQLFEYLNKGLSAQFRVVNLTGFQATHIYDLLGLFDAAAALITVDTAHLHLSRASPVPVIALLPGPDPLWTAAPVYSNQILALRYHEIATRKPAILSAVEQALALKSQTRVVHVWNDYERNEPFAIRRHKVAKESWEIAARSVPAYVSCRVHDSEFHRESHSVLGDPRAVPFLRDLIEFAVAEARWNDVIVVTNDDTVLANDALPRIVAAVKECGAIWGARCEFKQLLAPVNSFDMRMDTQHVGADVFAFTRHWWNLHNKDIPDMVIGYEAWDYIFRRLITMVGGQQLFYLAAHEYHYGYWTRNRQNPASVHNRTLAEQWLGTRGLKWT